MSYCENYLLSIFNNLIRKSVVSKQKLRQAMTTIVLFLYFLFSPSSSGMISNSSSKVARNS